jgi:hypothetical protein
MLRTPAAVSGRPKREGTAVGANVGNSEIRKRVIFKLVFSTIGMK